MCMNQLPIESAPVQVIRTDENFIRTYTGKKFWPLTPITEEICIEDIAHALSLICRFTGHCYCFYSVAEHSIRVSHAAQKIVLDQARKMLGLGLCRLKLTPDVLNLAREVALWGLLHDASEAYLCDVPSPIKHASQIGQLYREHEARLMEAIAVRFDLIPHEPSVVKDADRILLNTELRDLMTGASHCNPTLPDPIFPIDSSAAELEFLHRFHALDNARKAERIAAAL